MQFSTSATLLLATAAANGSTSSSFASAESVPVLPQTCAIAYDDPHLTTFDGHNYDCQGNGDFILSKSLDSDFELQGRFYKEDWPSGLVGTTTEATVLKTGVAGEPKVEASYDRQCNLKYYINDELLPDLEDTLDTTHSKVSFYKSGKERYFYFEDSGISLHLTLRLNHVFGCFLNVKLCLPDSIKSQNLVGLMGSPDGNTSNDYMDRSGKDLETVGKIYWGQVHDYCTKTWCVGQSDSLFETPGDASLCQEQKYDDKCEKEVEKAPKEVKDKCGDDLACIIDSIVSGDSDTGTETKNDERDLQQGKEEIESCDDSLQMETQVCELPNMADDFSVVTLEDAHIGSHAMYKGIAIGGTLYDSTPKESGTIDKTVSYIKSLDDKNRFNFNKPKELGSSCVSDSMRDRLAYLARHAKPLNDGHYVVDVKTKGGTYSLDDFRKEGQGEDNGMTLAIFNTKEDIIITKSPKNGRQFGPTIIAPFAKVTIKKDAGYVDGSIYAKTLYAEDGQLQLHGDTYIGPINCGDGVNKKSGGTKAPKKKETQAPKTGGGSCKAAWEQCGGNGYSGATCCVEGHKCVKDSNWWSACKPTPPKKKKKKGGSSSCKKAWEQCGGNGYSGETCCVEGTGCVRDSEWWSACKPGAPTTPKATATPAPTASTPAPTQSTPSPTTPAPSTSESCGTPIEIPSSVTFGEYSGNPQCVSGGSDMPFGFEYGWKMNGCQDGTYLLNTLPGGDNGEIKGSCAAASTIEVSVTCNADKSATIFWSGLGDSKLAIKVKGGNGGTLYDGSNNGGSYIAGRNGGGNVADISHIELCIQCDHCGEEASTPAPSLSTPAPTQSTPAPTKSPSSPPTGNPTAFPTAMPSSVPIGTLTGTPTASPTDTPTKTPTGSPTVSTPNPTQSTPAPTQSTPSPTVSTPSPTQRTPAPTQGCPEEMPRFNAACGFEGKCPYGKETCCDGTTHDSVIMECADGITRGFHTDACFGVTCEPEKPKTPPVEKCPEKMPEFGSKCNFAGKCPYGKETCCDGSEHDNIVMECNDGVAQGLHTDACMAVKCEEPPVVCATDTKTCKDGTVVGRSGPDCEFVCPKPPKPEEPEKPKNAPPGGKGSSSGDPHFKTWMGDKYDYHGECDLVLVDSPSFANGLGLRVHIRTTRVKYFSYIERIALQIGSDVLEFDNDVENFLINGAKVEENKKHHKTHLGGFVVRRDPKAISIRLAEGTGLHQKTGAAKIDLIHRKNGFPAVIVDGGNSDIFKGSLGLLGEWGTGRTLARDGKTVIPVSQHEATQFALEWQVRDDEPMLFKDSRFPQFPTVCTPPAKMPENRLGASQRKKEAEEACSHWKEDMEDCVFDVIATGDILVAQEGHHDLLHAA